MRHKDADLGVSSEVKDVKRRLRDLDLVVREMSKDLVEERALLRTLDAGECCIWPAIDVPDTFNQFQRAHRLGGAKGKGNRREKQATTTDRAAS